MENDKLIKEKFFDAIDKLDGKEHFYSCDFWTDFKCSGRKFKIEKEGHLFVKYNAIIDGSASFSKVSMRISEATYCEIKDYFELKLLTLIN